MIDIDKKLSSFWIGVSSILNIFGNNIKNSSISIEESYKNALISDKNALISDKNALISDWEVVGNYFIEVMYK